MTEAGFRRGERIEEPEDSRDILLRQLEIAHKREDSFGRYMMLTKGWAITLLTAIIVMLYRDLEISEVQWITFLIIVSPFALLLILETLIAAYGLPYYEAIRQIENELSKKKCERYFFPLTYKKGKKVEIVLGNFWNRLCRPSILLFYLFIMALLFSSLFISSRKILADTIDFKLMIFIGVAAVLVNVIVAWFIKEQVEAQKLANRKSTAPILGITLKRDKDGNLTDTLIIYVRNHIAQDINCTLYKNETAVECLPGVWPTAVPALRADDLLPIWEKSFGEDILGSTRDSKVVFKAIFDYKSILRDEFRSKYFLFVWKESDDEIRKEERLELELPF